MLSSALNFSSTKKIVAVTTVTTAIILSFEYLLPTLITSKPVVTFATSLIANGSVPDWLLRIGIRHLIQQRVDSLPGDDPAVSPEVAAAYTQSYVDRIKTAPIALDTAAANEQHYELPPEYFQIVLGPRRKYSCCLYEKESYTLAQAEDAAFNQVFERAKISDGDFKILDLGCGWGSCTLTLLERFPNLKVTAVSNSKDQGNFIRAKAAELGGEAWTNRLTVLTQDANNLHLPDDYFDKIISIEMLEHMKNYDQLFARLGRTIKKSGIFFVHVFNHCRFPYDFVPDSDKPTSCQKRTDDEKGFSGEWMSRTFFANGTMPSPDLLHYFYGAGGFQLDSQWAVDGKHYARTAEDWLKNQDANQEKVEKILYDSAVAACKTEEEKNKLPSARQMAVQWRLFYLAVAENWNFNQGREWFVSHYRFVKN